MKKSLLALAAACAAFVAPEASATTFPTLTTIYVGSGVYDNGAAANAGVATSFICTNASGLTASMRFLVLDTPGSVAASNTTGMNHGETLTASTHSTFIFADSSLSPGILIQQGGVVIESTQSGVFCTAMILDASTATPNGIPLHLVRVNPHPGTVE